MSKYRNGFFELYKFSWDTLNGGHVIPGYGHAVLRVPDPRFTAQMEFAKKRFPQDDLVRLADMVFDVVPTVLKEQGKAKNPAPNVDAISGTLQHYYGVREFGMAAIMNGMAAALTSGRTHHELLLIQVGEAPGPLQGRRRGLYHIGIKVGDSLDELRTAKRELEQAGVTIDGMSDHTVSQSLYLRDPDGNEVEVYVDADESLWKTDPAAVVSPIKPLHL